MPLNSAVYEPGRDKIYAVRSGRVFQLNAATGAKEAESRFLCPAMDDSYLDYDSTTDSLWVVMRRSFGTPSESSFPIKWLVKIHPDTLAATRYSFRTNAGGDGVVTFGDNWFNTQSGPFKIKCNSGVAFILDYGDGAAQGGLGDLWRIILTTTPPSEDLGYSGVDGGAWGDILIDGTNIWFCGNDGYNGIFARTLATLGGVADFVQLNGIPASDTPYGIARVPGAAMYICQGTPTLLKGTPAAVPVLRTTIALGRPNATPFHIRYAAFNNRIYIPLFKDDTVAVLNPADDSFVIKTGFDTPWDVVVTNARAFAVQHAPQGLKEIV